MDNNKEIDLVEIDYPRPLSLGAVLLLERELDTPISAIIKGTFE